jgi:hypothetical protein
MLVGHQFDLVKALRSYTLVVCKKAILFKKKIAMKNNSKRILYFLTMVSLMILLNACRAAGCGCPMH